MECDLGCVVTRDVGSGIKRAFTDQVTAARLVLGCDQESPAKIAKKDFVGCPSYRRRVIESVSTHRLL